MCIKDRCWCVRTDYILEKLPDVSGPSLVEAKRYKTRAFNCLTPLVYPNTAIEIYRTHTV